MSTKARNTIGCAALAALALVLFGLVVARWVIDMPALTEQQVRDAVVATIQRESAAAFLVTGQLTVRVETRVENTRTLLPGILDLDLGTTSATVRVPGTVSYGFEVDSLKPEMVRLLDDGVIEIDLPRLHVYAADPDLGQLEVETARGWARLGTQREHVERRALELVEGGMRDQALQHLRSSYQPRVNAARALRALLAPALRGLGMAAPEFQFRLGDDLVVMPSG